ncbi:MAG: molecular chaperone DnaJ, partial [Clostridia bacterium]|nr:molecular chaperone DnaJ [Clostridia bacterium]
GEPGTLGGPYGDLYIEVHLKPHSVFQRNGNQTFCEVPVTFAQLALGAEIEIPTIDGNQTYTLKEGTQPGERFTIRGKGIPYVNRGGQRGDHVFQVILEVPRHLEEHQKTLLQEFEATCSEKNYQKRGSFFQKIKEIFSKD